ncbi:MAG: LysR family transcriptional regulator [Verrucomicrobiota bacterium]
MDLRKLRYFQSVAQELSFSKAARRIGISQPTLSRAIQDVEDYFGATLFLRGSNSIQLTEAGDLLINKVDEILVLLEEAQLTTKQLQSTRNTLLRIGCLPCMFPSFLGDALNIFCQSKPNVKIEPHSLNTGPVIDLLRRRELDIAFLGHMCEELQKEFAHFTIAHIPLAAVVAAHHPLADSKSIELIELKAYSMVGLTVEEFPKRTALMISACNEAGFTPEIERDANSLFSALASVSSSNTFTLMPIEMQHIAPPQVKFLHLKTPQTNFEIVALTQPDESRKSVLALLHECIRVAKSKNLRNHIESS